MRERKRKRKTKKEREHVQIKQQCRVLQLHVLCCATDEEQKDGHILKQLIRSDLLEQLQFLHHAILCNVFKQHLEKREKRERERERVKNERVSE